MPASLQQNLLWRWGFVALVGLSTAGLFTLYSSAILDKDVDWIGKLILLLIAAVGTAATLIAGGRIVEFGKGLSGYVTPKATSLVFVAIIATFGLLSDVYGFLQPRPATESEQGKIERNTDAILDAMRADRVPSDDERAAWNALEAGNCEALRRHIEHFPGGVYAGQAANLLNARHSVEREVWKPVTRRLRLTVIEGERGMISEAAARSEALVRSEQIAADLCGDFAASSIYRLRKATPAPETWDCSPAQNGHVCGFSGKAVCDLDMREVQIVETCGAAQ